MKYNLFTPPIGKLSYPHFTKIEEGKKSDIVHVTTHPEKIIHPNDIIHSDGGGAPEMRQRKVLEVLEQRPARGQHYVDFIPVFQKLKTALV
jgi:hypothetical protein